MTRCTEASAYPVAARVAARSMLRPNDHRLPSGALDLPAIRADYRKRLGNRFEALGGEGLLSVVIADLVMADPFHRHAAPAMA